VWQQGKLDLLFTYTNKIIKKRMKVNYLIKEYGGNE